MSRLYARIQRAELERRQRAAIEHALRSSVGATTTQVYGRHTPGDARLLRGIPVVGVRGGLGGAIPGSKPGERL